MIPMPLVMNGISSITRVASVVILLDQSSLFHVPQVFILKYFTVLELPKKNHLENFPAAALSHVSRSCTLFGLTALPFEAGFETDALSLGC